MVITGLLVLAFGSSAFAWSPRLEGKPDNFAAGASRGYYIWHDGAGWHVWTATRGQEHEFSGVVRTNGKLADPHGRRLEFGDFYRLSPNRDTLTFRFNTTGGEDGLNFQVDGGRYVEFDLFVDGQRINRKDIYIGDRGWHPSGSDFRLMR